MTYLKRKRISTFEYVQKNIEDATRFVAEMLGYSPREVWQMNCYEFFRDLIRAKRKQAAQIKQADKWQTKK